ncbi:MAG: ATP-binding protein [Nanoarchaeota archaeon]
MKTESLVEWNPWWSKKPEFNLLERDLEKELSGWLKRKEIIAIMGVRRSGKTSLCKLVIEHLLERIDPKNVFFIKADDERVEKQGLISHSLEAYREFMNPQGKIFVFIDEIQEIPEWESTLKRMYDLESDVKFFISGSNFSVLREDLSFKLAGRCAYFDIYPFSFGEFLRHALSKDVSNKVKRVAMKKEIQHHLFKYMEFGGFPEVVLEPDEKKKTQLLRFYYDTIVYRDIIRRREIRSAAKMENMINYFLQNIANTANFTKVAEHAALSTDSITEYARYLQDAFFIFSMPLFSYSVKKQEINPKKIYCVDTGLRNIKGFRFSQDYGRLMENIVFIELRRRMSANPLAEIFYWSNKKSEVDFLIKAGVRAKELVQVCWDYEEESVQKREIDGLMNAMQELKLSQGTLITKDTEGQQVNAGKKVKIVPLWNWLLEEQ